MLLTHWLTLFERDWQFALDVRTSRIGHTPSPTLLYRKKHKNSTKPYRPPVSQTQLNSLPVHWKSRRRQCGSR